MADERNDLEGYQTPAPTAVRVASGLLIVMLVAGAIGIALLVRHIVSLHHVESTGQRVDDLAWLSERILQWVTAGIALWAIRKRRPLGRWLTMSLTMYLTIKVILGFRGAVLVMLGGEDTVSSWLRFETPAEAFGGFLFAGAIASGLIAIAFSMVFNPRVRDYFASGSPGSK